MLRISRDCHEIAERCIFYLLEPRNTNDSPTGHHRDRIYCCRQAVPFGDGLSRYKILSTHFSMPKAYLHYEGTRGPAHTFVWTLPKERVTGVDLDRALSAFAESYNRKHGQGTYDGGLLIS